MFVSNGNVCFIVEVIRSELSAGDVNEMYRSSHSVVELIKDMLTSNAAAFKVCNQFSLEED